MLTLSFTDLGGFLGTGMMVEDLRQAGTWHVSREVMKMVLNTGDSWSAQCLRALIAAAINTPLCDVVLVCGIGLLWDYMISHLLLDGKVPLLT